ncbi:SDR family oxidoreductase [Enterovibrio baiacu]|uniref:SDR family oxidoreductase n=1 Tax=Enterovibrio baiacu TaxID=2491023 RepID=UPI001011D92E|nr:SDR family oxidoreductase [Enterovibrio baiacu]MBE1275060.1 SDR family oxidoreductase [Enterovibrio baiacu]
MQKPYKTVSVCGCGWLGLPLAESLVQSGYQVFGTKRVQADADALNTKGIQGVCFDVYAPTASSNTDVLFSADVLVVNIPPGRRNFERERFVNAMKSLVDTAKLQGVKQLIVVSTTSVYGEVTGKVTEETVCVPNTESGKAHLDIEEHVLKTFPETGVVLRFSGLIGAERHPAKHLAGREGITNGNDPVNLIHRDDCIQAISLIINQQIGGGEVLHLSANAHPTRAEFYSWAAGGMGLPLPTFELTGGEGKCIVAKGTLDKLKMTLKYPSPFDMPLPVVNVE